MKYKLAIFDLDGTLLNTLDDLTDSLNYALKKSSYPERTSAEVRRFVGNGIHKLIERGVPQGAPENDIETVYCDFNEYYKMHCAEKTKPYDGICDLLIKLRNKSCLTAVVSNKADYAVQELCEHYFASMFDFVVGERKNIARKPSPDSVNEVLRVLDVPVQNAVYIGDSDVDILTAQNAGIDCISVNWGFKDTDFLLASGAKKVVSSADDIARIILDC